MRPQTKRLISIVALALFFVAGIWLRLYHIEFGLPHSFHADEPKVGELAIKYTYEFRDIIKNNNYQKLIPDSFIYGTFPSYLFTLAVMTFSKTLNFLNVPFSKETLYVFMRIFNAALSMGIVFSTVLLYKKLFNNRTGVLISAFLLIFNWKLIVHAHYINVDVLLTLLLTLCYLWAYLYYKHKLDNKHVVILGLLYGLAAGTKITALISLPIFLYLFLAKKDYRGLFGFLFLIFIGFAISNPFSFIFIEDFAYRVYIMRIKEAGMIFDSVDSNPLKYLFSIGHMATPIILISGVYGAIYSLRKGDREFHIFLVSNILIYLIFYSLSSSRIDRWILPILPLILLYGSEGIHQVMRKLNKKTTLLFVFAILGTYLYFPYLLLDQFQRQTPKSEAYIWAKENLPILSTKLVITEEGLDPFNKLNNTKVVMFESYESEYAYLGFPPDPKLYNYVIISSRPMQNFKKKEVAEKYNGYTQAWNDFEKIVLDESKFRLIKEFTLPKPNLVELSDVYIYQNTAYR